MFDQSTAELSQRARQGDAEAFGELYSLVWHDLYRFACYYLGSREEAEDAVQDTAAEAFRGIGTLRSPEAFQSWIFAILVRKCKRAVGRVSRRRNEAPLDGIEALPPAPPMEGGDPVCSTELKDLLMGLREEDRALVLLSAIQGYNSAQIASLVGRPAGTVRSRLCRAYQKLRRQLLGCEG